MKYWDILLTTNHVCDEKPIKEDNTGIDYGQVYIDPYISRKAFEQYDFHSAFQKPEISVIEQTNVENDVDSDSNSILGGVSNDHAPDGFDSTSLNDSEISEVLSMLLEFKEKYFSEVILSEELQKSFVWNLPKEIYNIAMCVKDTDRPDCLNPIYWFYMFCTDISIESIAKFILVAYNSMKDSDFDYVEELADYYDDLNHIEDEESDFYNLDDKEEDDEVVPFAEYDIDAEEQHVTNNEGEDENEQIY